MRMHELWDQVQLPMRAPLQQLSLGVCGLLLLPVQIANRIRSLLDVLEEHPLLDPPTLGGHLAPAVPLAPVELALVLAAVLQELHSVALSQVGVKSALVHLAVRGHQPPLASGLVVQELALVDVAVAEVHFALSADFVLQEGALVAVAVLPEVLPEALHEALAHVALVAVAVLEEVLALAVSKSRTDLPLVDPVCVLLHLQLVLYRLGHLLDGVYFLHQVLQLPVDYLNRAVRHLLPRHCHEPALLRQLPHVPDRSLPLESLPELLELLEGLVHVDPPAQHLVHYLVRVVNSVGLDEQLLQGDDVVIPRLQHLGILLLGLPPKLLDLRPALLVQSVRQQVHQSVHLLQPLQLLDPVFYRQVVFVRGPVLHLPQVALPHLPQRDDEVLAVRVPELGETECAEERVLLAVGVQADGLQVLLLMLLLHALQLCADGQLLRHLNQTMHLQDHAIYPGDWFNEISGEPQHEQPDLPSDIRLRKRQSFRPLQSILEKALKQKLYSRLLLQNYKQSSAHRLKQLRLKQRSHQSQQRGQQQAVPAVSSRAQHGHSVILTSIAYPNSKQLNILKLIPRRRVASEKEPGPSNKRQDAIAESKRIQKISKHFEQRPQRLDLLACLAGLSQAAADKFMSFFEVPSLLDKVDYKRLSTRLLRLGSSDFSFLSYFVLDFNSDGRLTEEDLFVALKHLDARKSNLEQSIQSLLFRVNAWTREQGVKGPPKFQTTAQRIDQFLLCKPGLTYNQYLKGVHKGLCKWEGQAYQQFREEDFRRLEREDEGKRWMPYCVFREKGWQFVSLVREAVLSLI